ncbi:MAG: hypothetical protein KAG61_09560 [Bacteriovoracaceae bacterium]|nr:hypothetical protein [Bacteriovoracaceae bacterium]
MRRAIIIENDPDLRKLYELNLDLYLGMEVIVLHNADSVMDFLKLDTAVDLIICEKQVGDENTILKVFYAVKSNKLDIPIFLLGNEPKVANDVESFEQDNWKGVIRKAAKVLKITAEEMASKQVPDYYPIPVKHFLQLRQTSAEVYDCQTDTGDDELPSFKEIFKANQEISKSIIEKHIVDGKKNLYVHKLKRLQFLGEYADRVMKVLISNKDSEQQRIAATSSVFYASQEMLNATGMTEQTIAMAKTTINEMMKVAEESEGLAELLAILEKDKAGYLFTHATLIAAVSHYVIEKMEWGTEEQQEKICIAAFFHDITIPDDKLAKIHSLSSLKEAALTKKDEEKVIAHAYDACTMIRDYPQTPIGTDMIILQHHCHINGKGFPESYSSQLTPLAVVFFVVEQYVDYMLSTPKEIFNKSAIIANFRSRFNKGYYRKVINALEEADLK